MARVMIEIDDALVEACKWHTQGICELTGIESGILAEAVTEGKLIPENATNGDVIRLIFPFAKARWITQSRIGITITKNQDYIIEFDLKWWDAKYKVGDADA